MKYIVSIILFLSLGQSILAQEVSDTTKKEKIKVVYADLQRTILENNKYKRFLEGNVQITKDSSYFYSDTAMLSEEYLLAWGNVSMLKNDSIEVYADSMAYDIIKEEAHIYGSVYVKNGTQILFSDYIHYDDKVDIAYYFDKAILKDDSTEVRSKRGEFRLQSSTAIFSEKVSVKNNQFELYADTLVYLINEDKAIFEGPTRIIQDESNIYCEDGYYNIEDQQGLFSKNASYQSKKDQASADSIRFDGLSKEVEMMGNAHYTSNTTEASGDVIYYNDITKTVEVTGHAYVKDNDQELKGKKISYNKETKVFNSDGRSKITMDEGNLVANIIESIDGQGVASGDIILEDTINHLMINGDNLKFNQENKEYRISGNDQQALFRGQTNGTDSMYMVADTFHVYTAIDIDTIITWQVDTLFLKNMKEERKDSLMLSQSIDTLYSELDSNLFKVYYLDSIKNIDIRIDTTDYMSAFKNVKIIDQDIQITCDSLLYNTTDSIITLYNRPIMWSDTTQFKADTIIIYLKNKKIDKVDMRPNALIINTTDEIYFNQIRGKRITAFFKEGNIDSMNIKGNAQSIYYMLDDNEAYVGVNSTDCSAMTFYFSDKKLKNVLFETKPTSTMYPMDQVNHREIELKGFKWWINRRPILNDELHPLLDYITEINDLKNRETQQ